VATHGTLKVFLSLWPHLLSFTSLAFVSLSWQFLASQAWNNFCHLNLHLMYACEAIASLCFLLWKSWINNASFLLFLILCSFRSNKPTPWIFRFLCVRLASCQVLSAINSRPLLFLVAYYIKECRGYLRRFVCQKESGVVLIPLSRLRFCFLFVAISNFWVCLL
jgi:hypothetical protein